MEYNSYMTHMIDFVRIKYKEFSVLNLENLQTRFKSLDQNGDGALNHYEFRHVVGSVTKNRSKTELTDDETDALIKYLDLDGDGAVIWDEFKQIFDLMQNPELLSSLSIDIQRAIRKV